MCYNLVHLIPTRVTIVPKANRRRINYQLLTVQLITIPIDEKLSKLYTSPCTVTAPINSHKTVPFII